MAQGGIVGFQSGEMVDGEAETVSVADAIAELGEEAFNYIKKIQQKPHQCWVLHC